MYCFLIFLKNATDPHLIEHPSVNCFLRGTDGFTLSHTIVKFRTLAAAVNFKIQIEDLCPWPPKPFDLLSSNDLVLPTISVLYTHNLGSVIKDTTLSSHPPIFLIFYPSPILPAHSIYQGTTPLRLPLFPPKVNPLLSL